MKKILKDRYLLSIVAAFLIFVLYIILHESGTISWLPTEETMPIADTAIDLVLFFSIVTLSALRFKVRGGIIAIVLALPLLAWCHKDGLTEADVWVLLLIAGVDGILLSYFVAGYAASKNKLQKALDEIKTLSGLLPICASCKKIRDDKGYWQVVEHYIKEHSTAEFTHSICPDCMIKLYPDLAEELKEK